MEEGGLFDEQPHAYEAAKDAAALTSLKAMQELSAAGILSIRDFAFSEDDQRHRGFGSVLPSQAKEEQCMYIALYDFQAEADNELSVEAGMPVQILALLTDGWVLARQVDHPEHTGLIPYTYLQPIG